MSKYKAVKILEDRIIVEKLSEVDEKKMTPQDKRDAKMYAKTQTFKKAKRLKAMCMDKHGEQIKKSNGKLTCGSDGKVKKGMDKVTKKAMIKARKKH